MLTVSSGGRVGYGPTSLLLRFNLQDKHIGPGADDFSGYECALQPPNTASLGFHNHVRPAPTGHPPHRRRFFRPRPLPLAVAPPPPSHPPLFVRRRPATAMSAAAELVLAPPACPATPSSLAHPRTAATQMYIPIAHKTTTTIPVGTPFLFRVEVKTASATGLSFTYMIDGKVVATLADKDVGMSALQPAQHCPTRWGHGLLICCLARRPHEGGCRRASRCARLRRRCRLPLPLLWHELVLISRGGGLAR